jgi:membrane protein DedA with SNARE-associated domain
MDLQTTLTTALSTYGATAIFVSVLLASFGLPLPVSFLLIAAGSFVQAGELDFWPIVAAGASGAIIGDHLGYALGRFGGRSAVERVGARLGAQQTIVRAETIAARWGTVAVFLSRWLITAISLYVNLISGMTRGKLTLFSPAVIVGEVIWVLAYVYLGQIFSDRVSEISSTLGDAAWVILALIVSVVLIVILIRRERKAAFTTTKNT